MRCLERLTRGNDDAAAACAAAVGTGLFAKGAATGDSCGQLRGNVFGLDVGDWSSHDWFQDGPPNFSYEHQTYHYDRLAISSPGCDTPRWATARSKCHDGFKAIHLYVALTPDASEIFAGKAAEIDPWKNDPKLAGNVVFRSLDDFGKIAGLVYELVSDCKIVRYLLVSSHGSPGQIYVGLEGKKGHRTITSFIKDVIDPCALAPRAKVQFDGCLFACGELAEPVRKGLETIFTGADYTAPGLAAPLEGVSFLLGTGLMRDSIADKQRYYFFGPTERHTQIIPDNGGALEYTLHGSSVVTDMPTSAVPACPERYKTPQKTIEAVAEAR